MTTNDLITGHWWLWDTIRC